MFNLLINISFSMAGVNEENLIDLGEPVQQSVPEVEVSVNQAPVVQAQPMEVVEQDSLAAALADIEKSMVQEREDIADLCSQIDMVEITGTAQSMIDKGSSFSYVVLSDKSVGADKLVIDGITMRWVNAKTDRSMIFILEQVTKLMMDTNPKNVVIDCFGQFLKSDSTGKIMKFMASIRNLAKEYPIHRLVFSSFLFKPVLQPWWDEISSLNIVTRNLNISLGRTPLQLHKCLLKKVKGQKKLCVRASDWEENRIGTGLGSTLSQQGVDRVTTWLAMHFRKGMHAPVDTRTSLLLNEDSPAPLTISPGFKSYNMVQFLKQIGAYDAELALSFRGRGRKNSGGSVSSGSKDGLRPRLQGVRKRSVGSMSSGKGSCRSDSSISSWASSGSDDAFNSNLRLIEMEGVLADMKAKMEVIKKEKEKEEKLRKETEENYSARCERYARELEWMSHDRRSLSEKHIALEEKNARLVDDRDRLRDLRDDWRERARDLEDDLKQEEKRRKRESKE
jgi:hypothetical protein